MKLMNRLLFIYVFLMLPAARAEVAIIPQSQAALTLEALDRKQFFRDSTCAEFSNFMLEQAGLPPLGQSRKPQFGERAHLSRRDEASARPSFDDGLKIPGNSSEIIYHGAPNGVGWALTVTEKSGEKFNSTQTQSIYHFVVPRQGPSPGFCRLTKVDVQIRHGSKPQALQLTGRACLRNFVDSVAPSLRPSSTQASIQSSGQPSGQPPVVSSLVDQQRILKTCANGMSYFSDLRQDALDIAALKRGVTPVRAPASTH